jgi:hypothetical protein
VIGGTDDPKNNPQGESTESTINFEEKTPSGEDTTL